MKEKILVVSILILGVGIGFFGWKKFQSRSGEVRDPVVVNEWSSISLKNTEGKEVIPSEIPGKLKLVYFGFSHCPDMCPRALLDMSSAVRILGEKGNSLTPVFISVDPERDSPELLANYVKQFPGKRLLALTGEKSKLDRLQAAFGAVSKKVNNPQIEGGYTVDHTVFLYVMDDQNRIVAAYPGGTDGKILADEIRRFL
ncbi:SCO family protein [Leptospira gomenensis]|uniref:SCO family protein n=1 Tax=Leptospira gomenensis TaxID=2484974 RepID=A0A5F1Y875_9LEPT|nr:SCO family protein [Leptospira gomenensis]TGK31141.1 SCO family protein [Leptospira gomenensis]TGK38201.1 SCO family protein [Leptospira gomenensis]TGK45422.1 SCO family protein [Leptospira gomenensis]TGK66291.1 SCO family protein [Leptospira gomenensis]